MEVQATLQAVTEIAATPEHWRRQAMEAQATLQAVRKIPATPE